MRPSGLVRLMRKHTTALAYALLVFPAYADITKAHRVVTWPSSIASVADCNAKINGMQMRFKLSLEETGPGLKRLLLQEGRPVPVILKDWVHHFQIDLTCEPGTKLLRIYVIGWEGHVGTAEDMLRELEDYVTAP
jgi:hypothetical protein